jgi:hypothetical protein
VIYQEVGYEFNLDSNDKLADAVFGTVPSLTTRGIV